MISPYKLTLDVLKKFKKRNFMTMKTSNTIKY